MVLPAPKRMLIAAALVALGALLVLSLSLTPAASAAKPAAACKPGQTAALGAAKKGKNTKKSRPQVCRSLAPAVARSAEANLGLARKLVPSVKALRAAAPARLRGRLPLADRARLDKALRRALARAQVSRAVAQARAAAVAQARAAAARARAAAVAQARAAAAGAASCDNPDATPSSGKQTIDGVTVTATAGRWGHLDEPATGGLRDVTTTLPNGASQHDVDRHCTRWDSCPDANGDLAGRYELAFAHTDHAEKDGVALDISVGIEIEADLVAHVGADARLTTFDWTATATGGVHVVLRQNGKVIKYVPDSKVRLTFRGTGADPRNSGKSAAPADVKGWGNKGGLLDATNNLVMTVAKTIASFAYAIPGDVSHELLNAEKIFYDKAACLDVAFDPATPTVQAGQHVPINTIIKAKADGATVDATYAVTPTVGSVADLHGRTPGPIAYTAPDPLGRSGAFQTFTLEALSKRGRALGTHSARAQEATTYWDVTFTGKGSYRRDEGPTRDDEHHVAANLEWSTTWKHVPVGDGRRVPQASAGSGTTGAWQDSGRFGASPSGDFTCVGALSDDADLAFAQVTPAGRLQLQPFSVASSAGDDPACDGLPGAPYAGVHLVGDLPALQATVDVDPSTTTVQRAVHSTTPLAADCSDLAPIPTLTPCTHSVEWTGTVTLTRVPA